MTDPENVKRAFNITEQTLDEIANQVTSTGYLCGDTFSIADLTAASLLAPLVSVDHTDMARPQPIPDALVAFYQRWADHPALDWVRNQYAQHRP